MPTIKQLSKIWESEMEFPGSGFFKNGYKFKKLEEKITFYASAGSLCNNVLYGQMFNPEKVLEDSESVVKVNEAIEMVKDFIEQLRESKLIKFE